MSHGMTDEELESLLVEVDGLAGNATRDIRRQGRRVVVANTARRLAGGYRDRELRRAVRADLQEAGFNPAWILIAIKILVPLIQWVIQRRRDRRDQAASPDAPSEEPPCSDSVEPPAP